MHISLFFLINLYSFIKTKNYDSVDMKFTFKQKFSQKPITRLKITMEF